MNEDLAKQIAALRTMTVSELRGQHIKLFGEENRSGNRQYLFRRIAWRLQTLVEGGLSERARRRAAELARDADVRGTPPPGWEMEPAVSNMPRVVTAAEVRRDRRIPVPGTILKRIFKGEQFDVTVLPKGFEFQGQHYRSLSAVAHAITGCHWNGYHFFNIQKPGLHE